MLRQLHKIQTTEKIPIDYLYREPLGIFQRDIEQTENPRIANLDVFSPDDERFGDDILMGIPSIDKIEDSLEEEEEEEANQGEYMDPDILELQATQILLEAHDYSMLSLEQTVKLKSELQQSAGKIQKLTRRLGVQRKIREAAHVLLQECEYDTEISRLAQKQLNETNQQIDAIATELWGLTQSSNEIRSQLQQHAVRVLLEASKCRSNSEKEEIEAVRIQEQAVASRLVADLEAEITELRRALARAGL